MQFNSFQKQNSMTVSSVLTGIQATKKEGKKVEEQVDSREEKISEINKMHKDLAKNQPSIKIGKEQTGTNEQTGTIGAIRGTGLIVPKGLNERGPDRETMVIGIESIRGESGSRISPALLSKASGSRTKNIDD